MTEDLSHTYWIDPAEIPSAAIVFGSTAAMGKVRSKIIGALENNLPVLIQGDSGTGKEMTAKFLHFCSSRRDAPFVKLNCAATPGPLLESNLFGNEQNAASQGMQIKRGLVEIAEGGTLFLEEIGDMSRVLQARLLYLLVHGRYTRASGSEERKANVRIICATIIDLKTLLDGQTLSQELFDSLLGIRVKLVPLCERKEDIPQICEYLSGKLARQFGKESPQLAHSVFQQLQNRNWPGNLRELENWIARIVIFGSEEVLGLEVVRPGVAASGSNAWQHRLGHLRDGSVRRGSRRYRGV